MYRVDDNKLIALDLTGYMEVPEAPKGTFILRPHTVTLMELPKVLTETTEHQDSAMFWLLRRIVESQTDPAPQAVLLGGGFPSKLRKVITAAAKKLGMRVLYTSVAFYLEDARSGRGVTMH